MTARAVDNKIILHPIVRGLLLRKLPPSRNPQSDYYQIHTRLRDYFHNCAELKAKLRKDKEDWQDRIEEAYHALSLGDPESSIALGRSALASNLALWELLLETVAQATPGLSFADIEKQAIIALLHAEQYHDIEGAVAAVILYKWLLSSSRNAHQAARMQTNLGTAYRSLPAGDRQANLEKAIACYEATLKIFNRETFPDDWAMTQNNLGTAYSDLPAGDRQANLEKAIACFEAALEVYTRKASPTSWAMTQNNLGNALSNLPTEDRQANLEKAIACYEAALQVYTREAFPVNWALIQNNIGTVYSDLPVGNHRMNLEKAVTCFETALQVFQFMYMDSYTQVASENLQRNRKELQSLEQG